MRVNSLLFKQRSKQFPNLTQFLESLLQRERAKGARLGIVGAIVGTIGGLLGAAIGIWQAIEHEFRYVTVDMLIVNVAVWAVSFCYWLSQERKARQTPQSEVHRQA